ncbi:MAG: hypothetical protein HZA37_00800 [Parcubacteria group bacterium]|nr:hypothetical protein [Parcubacteria group bacterium]
MMANLALKILRPVRFLLILLLIVLAVFFIWRFFIYAPKIVPAPFLEARKEGAMISQVIVGLTEDSNQRLKLIGTLESVSDYDQALRLVLKNLESNKEIRDRAFELSRRLETMAGNISAVEPKEAQFKAQEAVATELSLISKLISYNQLLSQLLEVLRAKIIAGTNGGRLEGAAEISVLIGQINEEITVINGLNRKFNETMAEFDSYFK